MFKNCTNSTETRAELISLIKSIPLKEVQLHIAKRFYNVGDVVSFLYNTIIAGGNGILYGPGGFGKSEITKEFFKFYGISPLVIVGHSGTDIESLLGIPNIKKLTEESIHEIAFENSIFNKAGILLFEEFLDVKPAVAAALKDIITEGGYRRGDEFIPSKVGAMFICSNKSPDEVVIDFSTAAFYKERFPYSRYVIWEDYSANSYLELFKLRYSDIFEEELSSFKLVAELCAVSCNSTTLISPRMAFSTVNLFLLNKDINVFEMISSLDISKLHEIKVKLKIEKQYACLNDKFQELTKYVNQLELSKKDDIIAFIYFGTKVKEHVIKYNVEGEALLSTISYFIDSVDVKLKEATQKLFLLGKDLSLQNITRSYEDIQKFIFK